jgi:GT2 family glycosyltransferase
LGEILKKRSMKTLRLRVIKNDRNLGYCLGNNVGLKNSKGEYTVFLNNDTYVSETWLEELVRVMDSDPSIGACQSRLISAKTGETQIDGWLLDLYGWSQGIILNRSDTVTSKLPFYVSGASMIVRRSILNSIDGFDPQLFFGDFDLCWRLRLMGYEMCTALNSLCFHYASETTKLLFPHRELSYHHDKERIRVLVKCYSIRNLLKRLPLSIAIMTVESVYCSFKFRSPSYLAKLLKSLVWNLSELGMTLAARSRTQRLRNIQDCKIVRRMQNYSVLIKKTWLVRVP